MRQSIKNRDWGTLSTIIATLIFIAVVSGLVILLFQPSNDKEFALLEKGFEELQQQGIQLENILNKKPSDEGLKKLEQLNDEAKEELEKLENDAKENDVENEKLLELLALERKKNKEKEEKIKRYETELLEKKKVDKIVIEPKQTIQPKTKQQPASTQAIDILRYRGEKMDPLKCFNTIPFDSEIRETLRNKIINNIDEGKVILPYSSRYSFFVVSDCTVNRNVVVTTQSSGIKATMYLLRVNNFVHKLYIPDNYTAILYEKLYRPVEATTEKKTPQQNVANNDSISKDKTKQSYPDCGYVNPDTGCFVIVDGCKKAARTGHIPCKPW